jgi:hypothetical protein
MESLSREDWNDLRSLLDGDSRETVFSTSDPAFISGSILRTEITNFLQGSSLAKIRTTFLAARVALQPEEQRAARGLAILSKPFGAVSENEWKELQLILLSDTSGAVLGLGENQELRRKAQNTLYSSRKTRSVTTQRRIFLEMQKSILPEYNQRWNTAFLNVVAGSADRNDMLITAGEFERVEQLLRGHSGPQQTAILQAMMEDPTIAESRDHLDPILRLLHTNLLDRTDLVPSAHDLHRETVDLITLNRARFAGATPAGADRGYGRNPDFAEIGQIRTNLSFIQEMTRPTDEDVVR